MIHLSPAENFWSWISQGSSFKLFCSASKFLNFSKQFDRCCVIELMKKVSAIFSILVILVAGMHLTLDVHHCSGHIAAMKLSFTGALASCGMEKEGQLYSAQGISAFDCCQDNLTQLNTDKIFMPANFVVKEVKMQVARVLELPSALVNYLVPPIQEQYANTGPPGNPLYSLVRLPEICIFRI